jgi:hypothetical protein
VDARTLPVLEPAGIHAFAPEPVSLAALKAANHVLEWYEGVAIVQEVCRAHCEGGAEAAARDLDDTNVTIDLSGRVISTALPLQDGPDGVRKLAELLRGILSDDVPVPLRLALSQAHSSPPCYTSLSEFSRALEYFERPNRSAIIQAAFRRWEQREPERSKQEKPSTEEPRRVQPTRQPAPTGFSRRVVVIAAAVGAVLALAIAGVLIATNVIQFGGSTAAADPLRSAGAAAGEAVSSIASKVSDRINPPPAPTARDISRERAPAVTQAIRLELRKPVTPEAPVVSTGHIVDTPVLRGGEKGRVPPFDEQPVTAAAAPAEPAAIDRAISTVIYSEVDADVVPPVAVYPHLPRALLGSARPDAATFDVVIDRNGKVESVRLRHAPRSIGNAMILTMTVSAAKAWRFQPAIRGGQAVRYRQAIWLPPTR